MELFAKATTDAGLSHEEIKTQLLRSLEDRTLQNVLIIPPDFTRFHSNAGYITNVCYHPSKLQYGYNALPDGEEVYFIPNPALGLWINRESFLD